MDCPYLGKLEIILAVLVFKTSYSESQKEDFIFLAKSVAGLVIFGAGMGHLFHIIDFEHNAKELFAISTILTLVVIVPLVIIFKNEKMARHVFPWFLKHIKSGKKE